MTKEEREALERLANEATPDTWKVRRYVVDADGRECGEWDRGNLRERLRIVADDSPFIVADMVAGGGSDARFIAAARTGVPALLTEVRELEMEVAWRETDMKASAECIQRLTNERDDARAKLVCVDRARIIEDRLKMEALHELDEVSAQLREMTKERDRAVRLLHAVRDDVPKSTVRGAELIDYLDNV